eukprot:COSAG05_NODE_235_length_13191_cov_7.667354_3_plen_150_part_00
MYYNICRYNTIFINPGACDSRHASRSVGPPRCPALASDGLSCGQCHRCGQAVYVQKKGLSVDQRAPTGQTSRTNTGEKQGTRREQRQSRDKSPWSKFPAQISCGTDCQSTTTTNNTIKFHNLSTPTTTPRRRSNRQLRRRIKPLKSRRQ